MCHCLALACERYRTLRHTFLIPKVLKNMRANGLISLVATARRAMVPLPHFKISRGHSGAIEMYVSLGTIMEPRAISLLLRLPLLLVHSTEVLSPDSADLTYCFVETII